MRASFCEGLLLEIGPGDHAQDGFLLGLFSMIDALLGLPLAEAVDRLPLSDDVRAALLGQPNALREVYDVVLAWERGDWAQVARATAAFGLSEEAIASRYRSALEFANSMAAPQPCAP
jgi:EAL and modified HD-GYP domain-containing signal transduction protein